MFARRRFSPAGFAVSLCMSLTAAAALFLLQFVASAWGERAALDRNQVLGVTATLLAIGLWQGYRHSHGFGMAAVRFRKLWRKRQWAQMSGFAAGGSLFGAVFGLVLSIAKWLPPAAENAGELTLVYAGMGALAGFIGGFASQFAPVRRRTSR